MLSHFLPSTFTVDDLGYVPGGNIISAIELSFSENFRDFRLFNRFEPYFDFAVVAPSYDTTPDPMCKSLIRLNTDIKEYVNVNTVGDYLGFYFDSNNDIKQYYSYIDTDNFIQPIEDSYTHEPIAYYQEVYI